MLETEQLAEASEVIAVHKHILHKISEANRVHKHISFFFNYSQAHFTKQNKGVYRPKRRWMLWITTLGCRGAKQQMMLLQINKQRSILAVAAYLQNEQNRAAARNCNGEAQARIKFNAQRKINQAEQYVPVFYLHSRDAPCNVLLDGNGRQVGRSSFSV
jgi:hypothetical protein